MLAAGLARTPPVARLTLAAHVPSCASQYNAVLRFHSNNAFLQEQCVKYKLCVKEGDTYVWSLAPKRYATTIHAINSAVIKLSKLQVARPVYRGSTRALLPPAFWEEDK